VNDDFGPFFHTASAGYAIPANKIGDPPGEPEPPEAADITRRAAQLVAEWDALTPDENFGWEVRALAVLKTLT
jgi:hypothetical protein